MAALFRFGARFPRVGVLFPLAHLLALPILAALAWTAANAPPSRFPQPALAVGLVAAGIVALQFLISYGWGMLAASLRRGRVSAIVNRGPNPYDTLSLSPVMRWLQLRELSDVRERGRKADVENPEAGVQPDPPAFVLLQHDEADVRCPCPAAGCAGSVLRDDALARLLDAGLDTVCGGVILLFILWTPAIELASQFWPSWGAVGGIFAVIYLVVGYGLTYSVRERAVFMLPSAFFVRRVAYRALSASLRSFLRRYRSFLLRGEGADAVLKPSTELHVKLLRLLSVDWSHRFVYLSLERRFVLFSGVILLITLVMNLAAGRCVAAFQIATAAFVLGMVIRSILIVSAFNSVAEDTSTLCLGAAAAARRILAASALHSPDPRAAAALEAHARLLELAAASAGASRARVLGQPVGYGTARGVLVAAITVGFAVLGAMRGFGVALTIQTVCPG
ncbi:hypothetical protein DFJ74DRAFT_695942 [Hyaloraphidium curvatum]|nr:hypothetical protein DFJ74DRAFT_695942 [Hyaloraphidium curvatum]